MLYINPFRAPNPLPYTVLKFQVFSPRKQRVSSSEGVTTVPVGIVAGDSRGSYPVFVDLRWGTWRYEGGVEAFGGLKIRASEI